MKRVPLAVEKRTLTGKKLKSLRKEGILPANVYGKELKSAAVQLPIKEFKKVFNEVHETGLVDLELNGEKLPVLIKNLHIDPRSREVLHADFHKVNLKQKITANIPLELIGEARAVVDGLGVLLHPISEIEVEALPTDLPEKIEIPVEELIELGQQITVADLKVPTDVTVLTAPDTIVVKIGDLPQEEPEPEPEAPAEGEEGAPATEGETPEAPAEGETKTEGAKPEETAKESPKEEGKKE